MSRTVLVVIGPSACGKSSVVRELHRRGIITVHPTWTTRPRRPDEVDGSLEHRFVSDAAFERLCASGFFAATGGITGLPYRYGLPPFSPGRRPISTVMIRAPYIDPFARLHPDHVVYQIEDSPRRARERLLARGCSPAEIDARLADNHCEVVTGRAVADRVFVNDRPISALAAAVATMLEIDVR